MTHKLEMAVSATHSRRSDTRPGLTMGSTAAVGRLLALKR